MKKKQKQKSIVIVFLVALFFLVLFSLFSFIISENANREETAVEVESELVEVRVLEESDIFSKDIEEEIEEVIEEDIEDLDVQEEVDEDFEEIDESVEETEKEMAMLPLLPREKGPNELRIGFMTDIHAKSNTGRSRSQRIIKSFFKDCMNHFIEEMNNKFLPDFILLNGDIIEGHRDEEIGSGELVSIKRLFDRTLIPKYWVIGNHDLRAVSKEQWKQSLGIDYLHKSFDVGNYRIIILDSNYDREDEDVDPENDYTRGKVSQYQLSWLKRKLKTDKKKIVFIHHPPLWGVDVHSNEGLLFNAPELQEVFSKNDVLAVFSGHIEDFFYDKIDGVKYFVLPGVVKSKKYQGTFAEIDIIRDKLELNVSYLESNGNYRKINIKELVD